MNINVEETKALFKEYSNIITNYSLPTWDSFPTIDLYMDQVITLLEQYMAFAGDEKIITQSMINNYVKLGIMPPPINKKYSRVHLAYLVIICILKQTLSMGTIQKIIPCTLTPEEVEKTYNLFIQNNGSRSYKPDARHHLSSYTTGIQPYSFLSQHIRKTILRYNHNECTTQRHQEMSTIPGFFSPIFPIQSYQCSHCSRYN